jgi:hypothetical protein
MFNKATNRTVFTPKMKKRIHTKTMRAQKVYFYKTGKLLGMSSDDMLLFREQKVVESRN